MLRDATKIVAFAAHPDDLEYYAGGTLSLCASRGADVRAVLATDGERGGREGRLAALRRAEQRTAARILGYRDVIFLGLPDRGLRESRGALAAEVRALLRRIRPDAVLTFDARSPRRPYIHPDHQTIGSVVSLACAELADPPVLLLFNSRRPNAAIDVGALYLRKVAALRAHRSQVLGGQLPRAARPLWRLMGRRSGFPLAPRIEAFRLVTGR